MRSPCIISPGGQIGPEDSKDLASEFARKGFMTIVVQYLGNVAAIPIPGNQERAVRWAEEVKTRFDSFAPSSLQGRGIGSLPVYGFGHSLGGAALGTHGLSRGDLFEGIYLFGVGELIKAPSLVSAEVVLAAGTEDGLIAERIANGDMAKLRSLLKDTDLIRVEGVNHFCILPDAAGSEDFRARDSASSLAQNQCIEKVVDSFINEFKL